MYDTRTLLFNKADRKKETEQEQDAKEQTKRKHVVDYCKSPLNVLC